MIPTLLLLAALTPAPPADLTIQTPRGVTRLPIVAGGGAGPVVSADLLVRALNGRLATREPWVEVTLSQQSFRFLLGAPILAFNDRLQPLAGWAARRQDSIFLPLQFVTELLPRFLGERYDFDVAGARLVETGPAAPPPVARLPNGLRPGHVITLDPGHGGRDPGNLGVYLPRGMNEKHVTLSVGLLLRDELRRRGIKVVMTRTTDTLISYLDRARYCT
ncbi:MAG: N-acetylmuramoyl-L-alanine amidase, partial [Gemmatimonadetes bacterium]|nr:N-acetylmuramoyl-L-alanine amidase [Gemmatimonadota bacterium]